MISHLRCVVCNKVSSIDIETNVGDFSNQRGFIRDNSETGTQVLCLECKEIHENLMVDYEYKDGFYNYDEFYQINPDVDILEAEETVEIPYNDNVHYNSLEE